MRIVIAHARLNTFGGGERATLELLRRLSCRHEVELWAGRYQPEATYPELAAFPRRDLSSAEWLLAKPVADAVISQTFGSHLLALRHPHTICYVHTLRSVYLRGGYRPDLVARRVLDAMAVRRASAVLANSAFTAGRATQRYRRPVEVLPPGVDEPFFAVPVSVGSHALYVGRLAPEKGLERLLRWSADLPIELELVGHGDAAYVRHLRGIAGPRVRFRGPLTGEGLAEAYAGCRFLAFLPHEEEFGLAALEAMAAAKPVIAIREGALPELVRDGETGMLVSDQEQFGSAARALLADDALCLRLGGRGREVAHAYTWDRFARRIEELCERR
ncbi:MAG TPA: glycosyltransferase family 4 protein [Ktedonobacterales bacterium]